MLEVVNVSRVYHTRRAVDSVSLTLRPGEMCALLGPNGSGKTTLMKMIAGLTCPSSGSIRFGGREIGPGTKAHIAYMPTENYFPNFMTVMDAGRYYADFFDDFDLDAFRRMIVRMELPDRGKIRQLSSGMSAKLRLALTLCRDAELMMFDEPLNGVDILTRAQVVQAILDSRASGRAMLVSTHLIDELENCFDRAVYMKDGAVVLSGSCGELREKGSLTDLYLQIYGRGSDGNA